MRRNSGLYRSPGLAQGILLLLVTVTAGFGQTTVYLPAVGAHACTVTAASSGTPSQITCANHGFSVGNKIAIINTVATQSAGFIINGLRTVASVVDANNFTIDDISGNPITGPASFSCSSSVHPQNIVNPVGCRAVQLTSFTTQSQPHTYGLDGASGALATSLQNTTSTGKANASNYLFPQLQSQVSGWTNSTVPLSDAGNLAGAAALLYWAIGDTTAKTEALNGIANGQWNLGHGGFACYENASNAFGFDCGNRVGGMDWAAAPWYLGTYAAAYSVMRSSLTAGQRTTFANQVLNGLSHAHNGLGMPGSDTDCTKIPYTTAEAGTVTFTQNSAALVGVGTHFKSYSAGDMIFAGAPPSGAGVNDAENIIASITDDTHLTFTLPYTASGTLTNIQFMRAPAWTSTNCGMVWYQMHQPGAPLSEDVNYPNYNVHLNNPSGANNITVTPLTGWILMALALVDDDPRAVELLADTSAYYYDQVLPIIKQTWTGTDPTNPNYYNDRILFFNALAAVAMRNAVISGPDYFSTDSYSFLRAMPQAYMLDMPGSPGNRTPSGTWGEPANFLWDTLHSQWMGLLPYMYPSAPESNYFTWWFRNSSSMNAYSQSWGWSGGNYYAVPPNFVFADPNLTQTSLALAPTQYLFRGNDQGECASYNFSCNPNYYLGAWASRTDNLAPTATLLFVDAQGFWISDHTFPNESGEYQISKNNVYLFGGNNTSNNCNWICAHQGEDTSTIEFGDQTTWKVVNGSQFFQSTIPRWASTDPTGDAQNRYSYGMMDLSGNYQASANVTRALRHIAHFKKSGTQEYIVVYDDLATSAPLAKATYLHFNINNPWPALPNPYPGGVSRHGSTITSAQTTAWLGSTVLSPAGQTAYVNETSWSGPNAYGVKVCAATSSAPTTCDPNNLASEWIVVHKPATSASSMPPLVQDSAANFRVVEVQDSSSPKVAAFGMGGGTYTMVSFTTTHAAQAQYLIAGLAPGSYTVSLNGTTLLSNQNVLPGDNTLYFESASGTFTISQSTSSSLLACDLNGDGLVNSLDSAISTQAALGQVTCTTKLDLNQDGVCNVLDTQRVINAINGLGCKIGP